MSAIARFTVFILITLMIPIMAFAAQAPSSVMRDTSGYIRPLILTDFVKSIYFTSTSTTQASTFPYATTTVTSATRFCLTGDSCIAAWPATGGAYPFTPVTTFSTTTSATTTSISTQGVFFASSTKAASQLPYASSTAITLDTLHSGGFQFGFPAESGTLAIEQTGIPGDCVVYIDSVLLGDYGAPCGPPFAWTPTTYGTQKVNATSTRGIWFQLTSPYSLIASSTLINYASTTAITVDSLYVTGITSALHLGSTAGLTTSYAGTSCTNQFVRSLNGAGAATCATVANTDLANSSITITGGTGVNGPGAVSLGSSGTVSLKNFFATTTAPVNGQVVVFGPPATPQVLHGVSTSTITVGTGLSYSGTMGTVIGGVSGSLTNSGVISGSCTGGTTCSGTNPLAINSFVFPFTGSATSSRLYFQGGINASSTVRFGNSGLAEFFWDSAAAQLGISTTSPRWPLTVSTSSRPQIGLTDGNNTDGWAFRDAGNDFFISSTSPLTFATTTPPAFMIRGGSTVGTAGNVGIATSTPWGKLSIVTSLSTGPAFVVGAATSSAFASSTLFQITQRGQTNVCETVYGSAGNPATSTAMSVSWPDTCNTVTLSIGTGATTIAITNATTSMMAGSRKLVFTCNPPGSSAGAITWSGVEWIGTAPTQTTTAGQCDVYSFVVTSATSSIASPTYKVAGTASTGFQ